jgi:hypothetical protein
VSKDFLIAAFMENILAQGKASAELKANSAAQDLFMEECRKEFAALRAERGTLKASFNIRLVGEVKELRRDLMAARAEVVDGVLVVDARREVAAAGPPATCPGICTVLRSVVPLDEPLDAGVSRFRSVVGAVSTCSSAGVTGVDRAILQCAGDLSALVSSEGAGETAGVATTQPTPGSTQPTC